MPANTSPIFTLTPRQEWGNLTAANTAYDGTGTVLSLMTGGTNGTYVKKISVAALGTNVASKIRVFLNNGGANTTATNNTLLYEFPLPASTTSTTATVGVYEVPIDIQIPSGYKILIVNAVAVAAGWQYTVHGGDY